MLFMLTCNESVVIPKIFSVLISNMVNIKTYNHTNKSPLGPSVIFECQGSRSQSQDRCSGAAGVAHLEAFVSPEAMLHHVMTCFYGISCS